MSFNLWPFRAIYGAFMDAIRAIPEKYIQLLCYDDPSGLTDREIFRFYHWMRINRFQFNYIISDYPYYSEYSDVDNKPCEVYDVSFYRLCK